jgi:hypothetical protein
MSGLTPALQAQQFTTIVPFNATWRYDQSGTDLGTAWRGTTFNDLAWSQGQGLLQGGEGTPYPVPFNTTISPPGATRITDYFRTTFIFNGTTNGVTVYATNLVDDGAVIYLNGVEAARVRMNPNPTYTTLSTAGPAVEGQYDVVTIPAGLLKPGQNNVLAVEVHQSAAGSSDVVWGTRIVVSQPTQLAITQQPQSQTVNAPQPATFSVTVSGAPVFYQWQKDQVNILNATNATYNIANVSLASAGTYRVVVSNSVSRIVSSDAVLTVLQDTTGPIIVSAILQDSGITNTIDVTFDEAPLAASVTTNNLRVIKAGTFGATAASVIVSNAQVSGRIARLRVGGPNWNFTSNYYVLVNFVSDNLGNQIAPNSVAPMSTQVRTNMAQISDEWHFYDWVTDPNFENVYTNFGPNAWFRSTFVENPILWPPGSGIFYKITSDPAIYVCAGDGLGSELTYSTFPVLFRRSLTLPSGFGTSGKVTFRHMVDDGLVLYLNGTEIYRWNMPLPIGAPLDYLTTRATATMPNTAAGLCITGQELVITNFLAGANLLAAAVYQANDPETDVAFGLEMDANFPRSGNMLLTNGPNANLRVTITRQGTNNPVISWPNSGLNTYYGYILQETSALMKPASNTVWRSVSNGTNGAVISPGATRFFRLCRGPNSPSLPAP